MKLTENFDKIKSQQNGRAEKELNKMKEKTVIFKENGVLKTTTESNYNSRIRNVRTIHTLTDFESAEEIIDYYIKYFGSKKEDFIIAE